MKIGEMLKRARERAGLTLRELGERIGKSAGQLSQIENDKVVNPLSPADMVDISDAVLDRKMLAEYCDSCPIRSRIIIKKFPPLNNIVPGSQIAAMKVINKLSTATDSLQPMLQKLLNSNFADDPDFREFRNGAIINLFDVKRGAEILLDQLQEQGVISPDELRILAEMQQRLCEEKGHHIPEKAEG